MKKILLFILFFPALLHAQVYTPVDSRSEIKIIIKNVGMDTEGRMSGLQGTIHFNPAELKSASFDMSIDAASINTDIEPRDKTLKEAEYLNTAQYPRISFLSKQLSRLPGNNRYLMKGDITIKGITREISFPFSALPKDGGLQFSGEMKLNRKDFRIGTGSVVLSEGFTVMLQVFARPA
ncbi:MAG: YceI family protein [Chitinophagaceae bacterium]|nr:YceI family protein [Chitinophagaceae bacterium]